MFFDLQQKDQLSKARTGVIHTDHGAIQTPIFMPVGTQGTVKSVNQTELAERIKAQIILANTYHIYLRPGTSVINNAGGIHQFINWDKPMLTDSGGFQVFSLNEIRKINEQGVEFRSYLDGSKHFFSPESVMDIQRQIGADIMMAFDECTPYPCDYNYAKNSMGLTHRWLKRCIDRFDSTEDLYGKKQALFPIVQGSTFKDLRMESANFIAEQGREGNAIGGLSVGEPAEMMYEMTELVCDILPKDKPRYLMGVGTPENILECIALGIDMFDCVMPTRNARNGMLFTAHGSMNMKNKKWEDDFSPIDEMGYTFVDTEYTKAYLRHLFAANEYLGKQIATIHNLGFYMWLVREARKHILAGDFRPWKEMMVKNMSQRL